MNTSSILIVAAAGLAAAYFMGVFGGGSGAPGGSNEQTYDVNGQQIRASDMWKYGYTWLTAEQHGVREDGWYIKQDYLNTVAQISNEGKDWVSTASDVAGQLPALIQNGTQLYQQVSTLFNKPGGGTSTGGGGFSSWGTGGGGSSNPYTPGLNQYLNP